MGRLPTQVAAELCGVDRIAAVVAGAVAHPVEVVHRLAHALQDGAEHVDIAPLTVRANEVCLADNTFGEDRPHGAGMVVSVNPVTHVLAVAVQFGADATQNVRNLTRDELLDVLVGTVVVRTVGDVARTPNVRCQARTSRSEDALVLEYGLEGWYGVSSVKRAGSSSARSP